MKRNIKMHGFLGRTDFRELICLLSISCNYLVPVPPVLGMGCVILLCHSLCLPNNHFDERDIRTHLAYTANAYKTCSILRLYKPVLRKLVYMPSVTIRYRNLAISMKFKFQNTEL